MDEKLKQVFTESLPDLISILIFWLKVCFCFSDKFIFISCLFVPKYLVYFNYVKIQTDFTFLYIFKIKTVIKLIIFNYLFKNVVFFFFLLAFGFLT